jgi:hypothetical protein
LWSYEACATPDRYSRLCRGYSPVAGNGFGSGVVPAAGLPNLAPGPEGFPFQENGGYPGINAGNANLGNPVAPRKEAGKEEKEGDQLNFPQ